LKTKAFAAWRSKVEKDTTAGVSLWWNDGLLLRKISWTGRRSKLRRILAKAWTWIAVQFDEVMGEACAEESDSMDWTAVEFR
jgi:hypothetical protein